MQPLHSSVRMVLLLAGISGSVLHADDSRNEPASTQEFVAVPQGGIFSVARNAAVQKELGLSADAAVKVRGVIDQFNAAWNRARGGFRTRHIWARVTNGTQITFQEAAMPPFGLRFEQGKSEEERNEAISGMMETWHATIAEFLPQIKDILTEEQFNRLQQIDWQAQRSNAFSDPQVIQALAITSEQQEQINAITTEFRARWQALFEQGGDSLREKLNELAREQNAQVNDVLTKSQLEEFAAMKGNEFDLKQLLDWARVGEQGGAR
jgi:hypothetical protein